MNLRYRVLVVDLDGTLLDSRGGVSPANRAAIRAVVEAGLEVIVATGRALVECGDPLERIGYRGLTVTAGGAMLNDAETGRTVRRHAMPEDLVQLVTRALLHHGHKALILKDSDAAGYDYLAVGPADLDPASQWWFETLPVRVRFVERIEDDPHPHDSVRAGAVAGSQELAPLAGDLRDEIGGRGFLQHWPAVTESSVTGSATHLLEVFNPEVNKWTMIEQFCRDRGLEPAEVAAIGDGLNDIQLVANAGLGIAMGNAYPEVIEVAERVTHDHESDGVAHAIGEILRGRW